MKHLEYSNIAGKLCEALKDPGFAKDFAESANALAAGLQVVPVRKAPEMKIAPLTTKQEVYNAVQEVLLNSECSPSEAVHEASRAVAYFADGEDVRRKFSKMSEMRKGDRFAWMHREYLGGHCGIAATLLMSELVEDPSEVAPSFDIPQFKFQMRSTSQDRDWGEHEIVNGDVPVVPL